MFCIIKTSSKLLNFDIGHKLEKKKSITELYKYFDFYYNLASIPLGVKYCFKQYLILKNISRFG